MIQKLIELTLNKTITWEEIGDIYTSKLNQISLLLAVSDNTIVLTGNNLLLSDDFNELINLLEVINPDDMTVVLYEEKEAIIAEIISSHVPL